MTTAVDGVSNPHPPRWAIILAFALVYITWGTTYLAIEIGVETLPPAVFGGARIGLAGLVMLGYLLARGRSLAVPRGEWIWIALPGLLFVVGGNWLLTIGEKSVPSGFTSVLVATSPLWMALFERAWPYGERLTLLGWLGIVVGLVGVLVLLGPQLGDPAAAALDVGSVFILLSSVAWSLGALVSRYRQVPCDHTVVTALQMVVGGGALFTIGAFSGELSLLHAQSFTPRAVTAFFYLLFVGSIVGFTAFNWLLRHVSVALVGTYAYVNPVVAIIVGWLLNDEPITWILVAGMSIILGGVALVRGGRVSAAKQAAQRLHTDSLAPAAGGMRSAVSCRNG
jgi:drug/metabolite transporter (DMT)-like permease